METLIELLQKSTQFLSARGVEKARLNAELIFAELLGCKRLDLYLMFERPLTDEERDALRPMIMRRGKREPLQYILGDTDFFGLSLKCDARALIPRQETEELAARLTKRFQDKPPASILDLGTGSGALALALARQFPEAQVSAVDSSTDALSLARENAEANGLAERVSFIESNWFSGLDGRRFDLIVSNPPYLTDEEWESAQAEVKDHEPRGALVGGGDDGADDLRVIITQALPHLNPGGLLALETGIAQRSALEGAARLADYADFRSEEDDSSRPRYFFARVAS